MNSINDTDLHRKIDLGDTYSPFTGTDVGGSPNNHDYDPASRRDCDTGEGSHWTCTICGNVRCYEVLQ